MTVKTLKSLRDDAGSAVEVRGKKRHEALIISRATSDLSFDSTTPFDRPLGK